jgi:hypothetical protein
VRGRISATVANYVDPWLFLTLAFGSTAFLAGNFVGKLEMIVIGTFVTAFRRRLVPVVA